MRFIDIFKTDAASILQNRKNGVIYTADFGSGEGKYISSAFDSTDPVDLSIQISPKVEVRIAYIFNGEQISGLQISKVNNKGELEKIHLSTLDWEGVLGLLQIFSEMDIKALARKNLILNEKITENPQELEAFLKTISTDPEGKEKMTEIVKNFGLIKRGDIDEIAERRESSALFDRLLNNSTEFAAKKTEWGVGKNEEVWQRFFKENVWILGAEFIEILNERVLDTENITDYIVKSYDGFADIIELKLPSVQFWNADLTPNSDLAKALMQCMRYISAIERRINDLELNKKLGRTAIVKPRITLIFGRSNNWTDEQRETYRILNANFHSISILTYDHVFERAKRMTANNMRDVDDIKPEVITF
ncbi:MAG: Shedu anti-phage system protein SduA domain-containing protein [Minisyncoccia bacterium]|jgi:hypothetical protein